MSNRRGQPSQGGNSGSSTATPAQPPPQSPSVMYQPRLPYPHNQGGNDGNVRPLPPIGGISDTIGQFVTNGNIVNGHGGVIQASNLDPQGFTTEVNSIVSVSVSNSPGFSAGHHAAQYATAGPPPVAGSQPMAAPRHYYQAQHGPQRMSHPSAPRVMAPNNPRGVAPNGSSQPGLPPAAFMQQQAQQQQLIMIQSGFPINRSQSPQSYAYQGGTAIHPIPAGQARIQGMIFPGQAFQHFPGFAPYPPPPMVQNQMGLQQNAAPPGAAGTPLQSCSQPNQIHPNSVSQQGPQQGHLGAQQPRPQPSQTPPNLGYGTINQGVPNSSSGPHSLPVQVQYGLQAGMPVYPQGSSQVPPAQPSVKRASKALQITNPVTGEDVLDRVRREKQKDEAKSEASEAGKKDEAGQNATDKDQSASSATPVPSILSMSIRDEFLSKVSKVAAESKAVAVKDAGEAGASASASKPEVAVGDDEASTVDIHSDNKASADDSDRGDDGVAEDVSTTSGESVEKVDVPKSDSVHSDQKPDSSTAVIKSEEEPKEMKDDGLEPISPTPLPDTPSAKTDQASRQVINEDAVKAAKPVSKRGSASKRAELNRKGAEKAGGSDMDVFHDIAKDASEPKEEGGQPDPSPSSKGEESSLISSSTSSLTSSEATLPTSAAKQPEETSGANVQVEPESSTPTGPAESETTDSEGTQAPPADSETAGTPAAPKENGAPSSTPGSQIKLKYSYKEDQWSPINMDGKKQYDRDFLIQLQRDPMSLTKPQNLPHMDIIKEKAITSKISPVSQPDFMPTFVKTVAAPRGPSGSMSKSRSRDGKRPPGPGSSMPRQIVLSLQERNVELRTTENAWKLNKKSSENIEPLDPVGEVRRSTMAILNKLTPQKFDSLIGKFNAIPIDTGAKLRACIGLIFEKAVDEPGFCKEYAKMCKELSMKHVVEDGEQINFRKLLIGSCQTEFEKDYMEGVSREQYEEDLKKAQTEDLRKEIRDSFERKEMRARRRSLGNTRFIGELFILGMLTLRIMHECIQRLLRASPDEESLESLCRLVTTVGFPLEKQTEARATPSQGIMPIASYFKEMENIIIGKKTSSRVRFLLKDLIDLRKNNWVPRRDVAGPKTIDQIHKEAEREKQQQQLADLANSSYSGSSRSLGGRDRDRDRDRDNFRNQNASKRSNKNNTNEDGWSTRPARGPNFDTSILRTLNLEKKKGEEFQMGSSQFQNWGKGAGSSTRAAQSQDGPSSVASRNRFGALTHHADHSDSPGDRPRVASRSVGGQAIGGARGSRGPSADNERQSAVKNPIKLPTSNGPSGFERKLSFERKGSRQVNSSPSAVFEVGPTEDNISAIQQSRLLGQEFASKEDRLLKLRLKTIIDEYCSSPNVEAAIMDVQESCTPENISSCVEEWINVVLDRNPGHKEKLGYLLTKLITEKLLQRSQVLDGLGRVLEVYEDLICDIPTFWEGIGELIVPLLESRLFTMGMLRTTAKKISESPCQQAGLYVEAVLRQLKLKIGEIKVVEMWKESCLDWAMFLPPDLIVDFVAKHKLEFIQSASSSIKRNGTPPGSPAELRGTLDNMLAENKSNDDLLDYVNKFLGGKDPDNAFIRTLATAITRSSLTIINEANPDPSQQSFQCTFVEAKLEHRNVILRRVLDGNVQRQKQALYALQRLMCALEHPNKVVSEIFNCLSHADMVSDDAFEEWAQCTDPAEQEGKGVIIKSTTQFFNWLNENKETGDESGGDE